MVGRGLFGFYCQGETSHHRTSKAGLRSAEQRINESFAWKVMVIMFGFFIFFNDRKGKGRAL